MVTLRVYKQHVAKSGSACFQDTNPSRENTYSSAGSLPTKRVGRWDSSGRNDGLKASLVRDSKLKLLFLQVFGNMSEDKDYLQSRNVANVAMKSPAYSLKCHV